MQQCRYSKPPTARAQAGRRQQFRTDPCADAGKQFRIARAESGPAAQTAIAPGDRGQDQPSAHRTRDPFDRRRRHDRAAQSPDTAKGMVKRSGNQKCRRSSTASVSSINDADATAAAGASGNGAKAHCRQSRARQLDDRVQPINRAPQVRHRPCATSHPISGTSSTALNRLPQPSHADRPPRLAPCRPAQQQRREKTSKDRARDGREQDNQGSCSPGDRPQSPPRATYPRLPSISKRHQRASHSLIVPTTPGATRHATLRTIIGMIAHLAHAADDQRRCACRSACWTGSSRLARPDRRSCANWDMSRSRAPASPLR